jgi:lipopolysaccharide transport protein LptA
VKILNYIALIALANAGTLRAQPNTNAVEEILALVTTNAPAPKPQPRTETLIESDGPADFDLAGRHVVYHDHVRVDDPEMKLRCEWLAADLPPPAGGRVTNIVAETNVVIDATDDKGQKMHATGDRAVYVYNVENGVTNETVTLTGNARLEDAQGWMTGDSIIWDRARNRLSVPNNPKMVIHGNLNGAMAGTNSPVAQTNSALTTNSVPTDTNFPPGKLDLIHNN